MSQLSADLLSRASHAGEHLKKRGETIVVAEGAAGGLISAALLAVPGASAYFLGGAVVYTRASRRILLGIEEAAMAGMRPSTEAYALLLARTARERFAAHWALSETGAAGPTGNRYGDAAGHCCIALVGATRAGDHHRDRQRRPRRKHARLHRRRARSPRRSAGRITAESRDRRRPA